MTKSDEQTDGRFDAGMGIRRAVLGEEYVDASLAQSSGPAEPLQKLVTEVVWGTIWARPGLDRRSRSLVNLGMLVALNQQHELGIHVRGALRNGLTQDEIIEVVLQTAVYCGAPAALAAMRTVQQVLVVPAQEASEMR
jgi:4-carboxymuconolactone decarboxylase